MAVLRAWLPVVLPALVSILTPGVGSTQAGDAVAARQRAKELVAAGRPQEAASIYQELLRSDPRDTTLLLNLAVAYVKAGDHQRVIAASRQAVEIDPNMAAAWLFLGAGYFQLQRHSEAIEPLMRAVDLQPSERNARLMLGESMLLTGRTAEAAPHFEFISTKLPDNPRVWYGLERSYTDLAVRSEAEVDAATPQSAYRDVLAGDAAMRRNRYGLALRYYRSALKTNPDLPGVHTSLAALYEAAGHPDWASRERDREPGECTAQTPACAFKVGAYKQCVARAETVPPPQSSFWKAKTYRSLASAALERLAALPASPQLYELRARGLDDAGRYKEAAGQWLRAMEAGGGSPILEQGLAVSLMKSGDSAAALALLQKLAREQTAPADIHFLCGKAHLLLERPAEAILWFRKALKIDAASLAAQAGMGEALLRAGQPDEAIPYLAASLSEDPAGTRYFQLARAYQATGQMEPARRMLAEYRKRAAENETRREESEREYPITPP